MKKFIVAIVICLVILIDLASLLYPTVSNYVNSLNQSRVVAEYSEYVENGDKEHLQALLAAAREYNESLSRMENRFAYTEEETAEYKSLLNTGLGVMGILVIDKINVKLPIYHGVDEETLQVGLGHLPGTSLPVGGAQSHAFITGHRGLPSTKLLTDLDKLSEGDPFALYILGETLTYQVDQIQVVEPHETRVLDIEEGMDYCTLVTCTPYGINSHRLLVRGRRAENIPDTGEKRVYADARRLDKSLAILIFLIPIVPALLIYAMIRCRKIHKGGLVRR